MAWPKLLVFVRHAESEGNIRSVDERAEFDLSTHAYNLTPRGVQQAEITGRYLHDRFGEFDTYYQSYYFRTKQTLGTMYPEARVYEDSRLAEGQRGIWHTMTKEKVFERFPEEIIRKEREGLYHYRPWGGENWPDIELRVHSFLGTINRASLLESNPGGYKITIWSDEGHCLIGNWGHNVYYQVSDALRGWSIGSRSRVNYVMKGMNPWSEHYGALMAEVPDPSDHTTELNTRFLSQVRPAGKIVFAGEALSHCLMRSVDQFAEHLGEKYVKRFVLLRDCTSPIPAIPGVVDFPAIAEAWLEGMKKRGMTVTDSLSLF